MLCKVTAEKCFTAKFQQSTFFQWAQVQFFYIDIYHKPDAVIDALQFKNE